jgi:hypothetical protein
MVSRDVDITCNVFLEVNGSEINEQELPEHMNRNLP